LRNIHNYFQFKFENFQFQRFLALHDLKFSTALTFAKITKNMKNPFTYENFCH